MRKSSIQSVLCNVIERVILDLLRNDVIGETLIAHEVSWSTLMRLQRFLKETTDLELVHGAFCDFCLV